MKLIVQIPCFNEEKTLPLVVNSIPRQIPGIDEIEVLIIDDGSSDRTVQVAQELGVHHIVLHKQNKGLAASFADGVHEALRQGADIIVNTDGDNQYPQHDIPKLIQPILDGTHDIVVADRQTDKIAHFSPLKKMLQKVGSKMVCFASGTNLPDAPSGFRAYSKEAAMSLNIITSFSYCMETIIHAGKKRIAITTVPVTTNPKTRESRLFKSMGQHVRKSMFAIVRSYAMHEPFKIFLVTGICILLIGTIPFLRYLVLLLQWAEPVAGHIQSLLIGGVFMILGFMCVVIGIIADLIAINRKLLEDALTRLKRQEYDILNTDFYRNYQTRVMVKPTTKKEEPAFLS
jgi:glycosyltransferase involved in cell wall biosynthesis